MPLFTPDLTPHFEFTAGRVDEDGSYPSPKATVFGASSSTLAGVSYATADLDSLATAIEKCFALIDLTTTAPPVGYFYNAGSVTVEKTGSTPTGIKLLNGVVAQSISCGEAKSYAAQIRAAGFGTAYV